MEADFNAHSPSELAVPPTVETALGVWLANLGLQSLLQLLQDQGFNEVADLLEDLTDIDAIRDAVPTIKGLAHPCTPCPLPCAMNALECEAFPRPCL
jgi:hypothetical protein